ncbi:MAG: DNA/RNA non-specific endonuclease [Lachnospiraceae bacterium]|nr:DNA/RNA non-specific endonuclease [Lachnospiraceae bacterium]
MRRRRGRGTGLIGIILTGALVVGGVCFISNSCGSNTNDISVLDIRDEMIREKLAEHDRQTEQERLQRENLGTEQSIPETVGNTVREGAVEFSDTTKTYTDAAKLYASDKASEAAESAGNAADTAKQKAGETADSLKEAGSNAADLAVDKAGDTVTDTKDTLTDLADGINDELTNLKDILRTPTSEFSNDAPKENGGSGLRTLDSTKGRADTSNVTASNKDGAVADIPSDKTLSEPPVSIGDIPAYGGEACVAVNNNTPFFNASQLGTEDYEEYSSYDSLGRAGVAQMCTSNKMLNRTERESIGMFKPSGWKQKKYDSIKTSDNPAGYVYNRCHLLMRALGGNDEAANLITATGYFNVDAMLPYENRVLEYVANSDNHVLYRVTPLYNGDDLVARGVLMEAQSVEDDRLSFCVFAYNIQPGIEIDYATGDSHEI